MKLKVSQNHDKSDHLGGHLGFCCDKSIIWLYLLYFLIRHYKVVFYSKNLCRRTDDTVNIDIIVFLAAILDLSPIKLRYVIIYEYILLRKTLQTILLTQQVVVDLKIEFMCNRIEYLFQSWLISATIFATILDFSLIAGMWNVYPRFFYLQVM